MADERNRAAAYRLCNVHIDQRTQREHIPIAVVAASEEAAHEASKGDTDLTFGLTIYATTKFKLAISSPAASASEVPNC